MKFDELFNIVRDTILCLMFLATMYSSVFFIGQLLGDIR